MSEEQFKVKVGVELDDASFTRFKSKIDNAHVKLNITDAKKNIDIIAGKLDELSVQRVIHLNTQEASNKIKSLKEEVRRIGQTNISLSGATKLEASLEKIAGSVDEIKVSLSSIGNVRVFGNIANAATKVGDALNNGTVGVKNFGRAIENINLSHTADQISNIEMVMNKFKFSPEAKRQFVKDIKDINLAIDSISTVSNEDNSITFTIKGIDGLGNAVTAIKRVKEVMNEDGKRFFAITKESLKVTQEFNKIGDAAQKSADEVSKSVEKIKKSFHSGEISSKIEKIKHDFKKMGNEGNNAFKELDTEWDKFKSSYNAESIDSANAEKLIEDYEKLKLVMEKASNKVKELKLFPVDDIDRAKSIATVEAYMRKNTKATKQFGSQLENVIKLLKEANNAADLNFAMREFGKLQKQISAAGLSGQSFGDKIKEKVKEFGAYFSISEVLMETVQAIKAMAQAVIEVDTAMTGLYRVTDLTTSQYDQLYDKMVASAKEYGRTLTDTINATSDWVKAGFDNTDVALGLAEITSMYQNISDLDYDTASQNLITAYNGFKDQFNRDFSGDAVAAVGHITDVLNQLDNEFAVTSAGLGESLTRSASAMQVAGNTFEETVAMAGAITEVTQDPEKSGSALKILGLRLRGMKGQLQELGEEIDENVDSVSKMQTQILNLTSGHVNIFNDDGSFKSTYEIMDGIAEVWDRLSSIEQADLLETIAGKNRANEVSALIASWDKAEAMFESAHNAAGSAAEENAKKVESLEGRINKLTATWQDFANTVMNSDFLKGLISGATGFLEVIKEIIDSVGTLPTLFGLISGVLSFTSFKNINPFRTIEEQAAISGKKIEFALGNNIKTLYQSLNGASGKFSFSSNLTNSLNKDRILLQQYSNALISGKDAQLALDNVMKNGSSSAINFAKSMDATYEKSQKAGTSVKQFTMEQKLSDIATQAQSKSIKNCSNLIDGYNNSASRVGISQQQFVNAVGQSNTVMGQYLSGLNGAKATMGGYIAKLVATKAAMIGVEIAAAAMNAAITMGVSLLISWAVSAVSKFINRADELAQKVDDITTNFNQQKQSLNSTKATIEEIGERYEELSKGVDAFGNNLSLTADEYSEYKDIVNQIADMFPNLVQGYDEQGNAILNCAGNVSALTAEYEKLIEAENNKVLSEASDIQKDFSNVLKDQNGNVKVANALEKMLGSEVTSDNIDHYLGNAGVLVEDVANALQDAGIKSDKKLFWRSDYYDFIIESLEKYPDKVQAAINSVNATIESEAEGMQAVAQAALSQAFDLSSSDYYDMEDSLKNVAYSVVNGFDAAFYEGLEKEGTDIEDYVNNMIKSLDNLNDIEVGEIENMFELGLKFDSGDITYGEYVKQIEDAVAFIDGLELDDEVKAQIMLSLNTEEVISEYDSLFERLTSEKFDIQMSTEDAEKFLSGLSSSEFEVALDLIASGEIDFSNMNIGELQKFIEEKAKLAEAMSFTISIEAETETLELFNTALAESRSAAGLTMESIAALEGRYRDLDGFDSADLFIETANGIRLNATELNKLESEYADSKIKDVDDNLAVLKDRYDELGVEIQNCSDINKRAELYAEQEDIRAKINELAQLGAAYEGLTSAYNEWQNAESSGNDRDMYANVHSAMEGIGDELKNGWIDDGTREYFQLIWGEDNWNGAGKSVEDYRKKWATLDDTIAGTSYSLEDFFITNDDGELTSKGITNFFKAIQQKQKKLGKDWIQTDEDGNMVSFDFGVDGEKAIAEALGISEELVQIFVQASQDAGFVVTVDGKYTQLADLQNKAEEAAKTLKEMGKTDVDFDFSTTSIESLKTQLEEADRILDGFKNKDGTIKTNKDGSYVEGAQEAIDVMSTLTAMADKLSEPTYMQLEANQVEDEFQDVLKDVQKFEDLVKKKHQLEITGADTSEVDKQMDEIANKIYKDGDLKAKLGIDSDASLEDIKKQLENGEVEIPATVDIQLEMDEKLEDIRLLMMHNAGLLTDTELKLAMELDTSAVDNYEPEEQEAIVEFLADTDDVDSYTPEQKKAIAKYIKDISDIDSYTPEDKKAVCDFIVNNEDVMSYTPEEKAAIAKYIADPTNINSYTPEEKQAIAKFTAEHGSVDSWQPEDRQAIATFLLNNALVEGYQPTDKEMSVIAVVNSSNVADYQPQDKTMTVWATIKKRASSLWGMLTGGGGVDGTAHVDGTAFSDGTTGRKHGDWGTKSSGVALGGELGTELLVRDGRWYTIGENGAEFFGYKKDDIIFNAEQTKELFEKGKITHGSGRGKALSSGTAFASGKYGHLAESAQNISLGKLLGDGADFVYTTLQNIDRLLTGRPTLPYDDYSIKVEVEDIDYSNVADENGDLSLSGNVSVDNANVSDAVGEQVSEQVSNAVEEQVSVVSEEWQRMDFDVPLDKEGLNEYASWTDSLSGYLTEAAEAGGLAAESIEAINNHYKEFEGYDPGALFEETSQGIKLNVDEVERLEKQDTKSMMSKVNKVLIEQKKRYYELSDAIDNETDAVRRSQMIAEQTDLGKEIAQNQELLALYSARSSYYSEWNKSKSEPKQRGMYEEVSDGIENAIASLEQGWIDDEVKDLFSLLFGDTWDWTGKTAEDAMAKLNSMNQLVEGTSYSLSDLWTYDEDGNLDVFGLYNFLDMAIQKQEQLGESWITKNEDGSYNFDFGVHGLEELSRALGISEELAEILLIAGRDANWNVNFSNVFEDLDTLEAKAYYAQDAFNSMFGTEYKFDFTLDDVDVLTKDLEEANTILDQFRNEDGSIKTNEDGTYVEGAEEALAMVGALQARIDYLNSNYIGLKTQDKTFEEPLSKLQEYELLAAELNQLNIQPDVNTEKIAEVEQEMSSIVDYFMQKGQSGEMYLGIDFTADEETIRQQIIDKIANGEIEIPASVNVDGQEENVHVVVELVQSGEITDGADLLSILNSSDPQTRQIILDVVKSPDYDVETKDDFIDLVKILPSLQRNMLLSVMASPDYDAETKEEFMDLVKILPSLERGIVLDVMASPDYDAETKEEFMDLVKILPGLEKNILLGVMKSENYDSETKTEFMNLVKILPGLERSMLLSVMASPDYDSETKTEFMNLVKILPELDRSIVLSVMASENYDSDVKTDFMNLVKILPELERSMFLSVMESENYDSDVKTDFMNLVKILPELERNILLGVMASENHDSDSADAFLTLLAGESEENRSIILTATANGDTETILNLKNSGILDEEQYNIAINITTNIASQRDLENKNFANSLVGMDNESLELSMESLGVNEAASSVEHFAEVLRSLDRTGAKTFLEMSGMPATDADIDAFTKLLSQATDEELANLMPTFKSGSIGFDEAISDISNFRAFLNGLQGEELNLALKMFGIEDTEAAIATLVEQGIVVDTALDPTQLDEETSTPRETQVTLAPDMTSVDAELALLGSTPIVVPITLQITNPIAGAIYGNAGVLPEGQSGTGMADGTTGRAFSHGNWGTKDSGNALVGELGRELVVRDGRYFTIGDNGAEFFNYKKNDIIFNAQQTEELLSRGKLRSGRTRGAAFVSGTAFADPSGVTQSGNASGRPNKSGLTYGGKNGSSSSSSSSSGDSAEEFLETIDWIEVAIDRIERAISRLDLKASSIFKKWATRNNALVDQIELVREEIDLQTAAYERYIQEANSVGLSEEYATKVRNGEINIEDITDESLKEMIDEYQEWYEKALDCQEAVDELKETVSELYQQRFDNVAAEFEGILGVIEHEKSMLEEFVNQSEAQAWFVSAEYYNALAANERKTIAELEEQKAEQLAALNDAVANGGIEMYSEAWYEMVAAIDETTLAIEESNTQLLEYAQTIQELDWEMFDLLQDKISQITTETEFLIDLLSSDELYDDKGQLTDSGMSTMGMHGVNYNVYMAQADQAAAEVARLDKELAEDPYDQDLIDRRQEMLELQQEMILAAQDEKEAIRDMVEEGIELELDALQELIDARMEALDAEKDLYDYQKKVKEQTEEIAALEKQMAAYAGDDSEETRTKVQELKVSLEEAKQELEETEYDRYISDQEALLDELYLEYETILNERLDNLELLITDMVALINGNSTVIGDNLTAKAEDVGYTLSESMKTIWNTDDFSNTQSSITNGSNVIKDAITVYGEKFSSAFTTTNDALKFISTDLASMIGQLNKIAKTNVKTAAQSSAAKSKEASGSKKPASSTTTTTKPTTSSSSGDGKPKIGDKVKFVSGQYFYDSQGKRPLGSHYLGKEVYITGINEKKWATHPYHISTGKKMGSGDLGWLKLNQLSGYASGKKNLMEGELAWTQENGQEFIIRPSDGAVLTPIAKGDSVLSAAATNNLWDMANNPVDFIRDNLGIGDVNAAIGSGGNTNIEQNIEQVVFSLPNVKNYEQLLTEMQRDKNFERLILSMTIDQVAGKSSLAKGKALR